MKKIVSLGLAAAVVAALAFSPMKAFAAGNATLSLNPASANRNVGTTFAVAVFENSNTEAVNAVTVKLNYDAAKLQFVSVDPVGSSFGQGFASTSGSTVNITRYTDPGTPALTGSQKVVSVSFKVVAGSGTTALTFAAGSQIATATTPSTNIWNGDATGATYTLVTPAAAPAPVKGATTTATTTPSTSTSTKKSTSTKTAVLSEEAKKVAADAEAKAAADAKAKAAAEAKQKAEAAKKPATDEKKSSSTAQKILLGLGIFALAAAAAQALQRRKMEPAKKSSTPAVVPPSTSKKADAGKKTGKKPARRR